MSSASTPPSPARPRKSSQARPRSWYGRSAPSKVSGAGDRLEPLLGRAGEQVAEPAVGLDAARPAGHPVVTAPGASIPSPSRSSSATLSSPGPADELQPGGQPPGVQLDPLAAQPDQRRLQLGQLGQLRRRSAARRRGPARSGSRRGTSSPTALALAGDPPGLRRGARRSAAGRAGTTAWSTSRAAARRNRPWPASARVLRKRCAPSVSSGSPVGRAVRSAPSSSG